MFVISYSDIKLEEFITMALDISLVLAAFVISFIASIFVKNTVVKLRENNRVEE
jgi:hypothetical protein